MLARPMSGSSTFSLTFGSRIVNMIVHMRKSVRIFERPAETT